MIVCLNRRYPSSVTRGKCPKDPRSQRSAPYSGGNTAVVKSTLSLRVRIGEREAGSLAGKPWHFADIVELDHLIESTRGLS